jgi:hypothetical protein
LLHLAAPLLFVIGVTVVGDLVVVHPIHGGIIAQSATIWDSMSDLLVSILGDLVSELNTAISLGDRRFGIMSMSMVLVDWLILIVPFVGL